MALIVDVFQPFSDNFAYLLHDEVSGATASVDAGEAEPVARRAAELGWRLSDVFITHHHSDHTGGVAALKAEFGLTVTGPAGEKAGIVGLDRPVAGGDTVMLGETRFEIIDTPGHTLGHICYHAPSEKCLFTGDALFSLGCGRMFEGEPKSMWTGLLALRALPDETKLYCGHEYTLANARFALSIDPDNRDLLARASEAEAEVLQGRSTIPTTLGSEKKANPFLRADDKALAARMGLESAQPYEVFAAIRKAKDGFGAEMELSFRPVTSDNVQDFIALFEGRGGPKHCWCMVWRGNPEEKHEQGGALKKPQMLKRIAAGTPVGLLGYDGDMPRAWVSVAPRPTHNRLGGPDAGPGENIWSLTCMFLPRALRGKGLAHELIAAAISHARGPGATILEAYPVLPDAPSFRYGGFVPAFERAGFAFSNMAGTRRHVMRLRLG